MATSAWLGIGISSYYLCSSNYRAMGTFKYISMAIVGTLALIIFPVGIANADELIVRVDNIKEAGEIHNAI